MNSKSLLLLALLGYTVSGVSLKQTIVAVPASGSATLVSTAAGVSAETTTGSQVISDLTCSNNADVSESSTETGTSAAMGCEAAKRLYLFGGNFDYYDTLALTESGAGAS